MQNVCCVLNLWYVLIVHFALFTLSQIDDKTREKCQVNSVFLTMRTLEHMQIQPFLAQWELQRLHLRLHLRIVLTPAVHIWAV